VQFSVDPKLPRNRIIADLDLAPTNKQGKVEFASDLLLFVPKDARRTRGTVFLEIVNRGQDQSLAIMSGAQQRDLSPESWVLGDRFLLEQGFTLAFLGWGFDVGVYEAVYEAEGSPVAGLGLAAIRDFASYLRYGPTGATLRENPAAQERIIGYGYSQSGRFLREFVRDGFNADERGKKVFD